MEGVGVVNDESPLDLRKVKFFTKYLKMGNVKLVPIRRRGMTGSGRKLDCHSNVSKLVHTYGGYDVRGYYVEYNEPSKTFCFSPHSVWETPEGKLVEVTLHHWEGDFVNFFPLHKSVSSKDGYHYSNTLIYVPEGGPNPIRFNVSDEKGVPEVHVSRREVNSGKVRIEYFWGSTDKPYFEEHPEKLDGDYVSFSNPSISTGKYFEMRKTCR